MKIGKKAIQTGLAIVVLIAAGCDNLPLDVSSGFTSKATTDIQPIAVLSIAPAQNWYSDFLAYGDGKTEVSTPLSDRQFQKLLPGIDIHKPAVALLYSTENGEAEPLIYLPVIDYERFLDGLGRRFPLKRAIASSFRCGPYQLKAMQVGEYAVIGTSLDGIKRGPSAPEKFLQSQVKDLDFVFHWQPGSTNKSGRKHLASSLSNCFGKAFGQLISKSNSFFCGLDLDAVNATGLVVQINPVPENPDEIQAQLKNVFVAQGWNISTEVKDGQLDGKAEISSDKSHSTWAQVQPAVTKFLQSQFASARNRTSDQSGLSQIVEYGGSSEISGTSLSGSSFGSSSSSSGGSSGGGKKRRG